MNEKKEITFIIKVMMGGGAERVISLLSRAVADKGASVTLIITHQNLSEAVLDEIDNRINVISLEREAEKVKACSLKPKVLMLLARFERKLSKIFLKKESDKSSILKYRSRNYVKISLLKKYFKLHNNSSAVVFLYDSIFMTLLAAGKNNKIIISERGDPRQSSASKTTAAFMRSVLPKADGVVFQSPDAQKWYRENTPVRGTVIFNPVKPDLPEPFFGERKKRIVNFCRISSQKNLIMLVEAFALFKKDYADYELYIYGDPVGNDSEGYVDKVNAKIRELECENSIHILPSRRDIHEEIKDYAMFVSSSDFEGMSNSMLEAMALGLPCVCTDCPAGGARAVIKDKENGLLVPVGDSNEMYLAMKQLIDDRELAERVSKNAVRIRDELSVEKITEKWMGIIND